MPRYVPPQLVIRPVPAEPRLEVWRAVATDDREAAGFLRSFMSRAELGKDPIRGSAEEVYRAIHTGISTFYERENAAWVAEQFDLGEYVAKLQLPPEEGLSYAEWGSRGHLTIWGEPVKLAAVVVEIHPLDS